MKKAVWIARVLVGLLFIFSGLIKANDPLGLAYKMQEFFDAWNWHGWTGYTLGLSVAMINFEILAGVALLVGWQMRLVSWFLLLLMLFFLFLTSYVLFSGKITACGCFGDCIPLTPIQTFTKDVILLVLILFILGFRRFVQPLFSRWTSLLLLVLTVLCSLWLQGFVLKHLPFLDCLPFKPGNNLVQQMQMPADAIPDSVVMAFVYEKGGVRYTFTASEVPADPSKAGYTFVDRVDKIVRHGYHNEPPIKDFVLRASSGGDSTLSVLGEAGPYYILFRKDFDEHTTGPWVNQVVRIAGLAAQAHVPFIVVTGQYDRAEELFNSILHLGLPIYTCDVTAIKTAARTNPCLFAMNGPTVVHKWGLADFYKVTVP